MESYKIIRIKEIEHSLYGNVASIEVVNEKNPLIPIYIYIDKSNELYQRAIFCDNNNTKLNIDEYLFNKIDTGKTITIAHNELIWEYKNKINLRNQSKDSEKEVKRAVEKKKEKPGCLFFSIFFSIIYVLPISIYMWFVWADKGKILNVECNTFEQKVEMLEKINDFKHKFLYIFIDVPEEVENMEKDIIGSIDIWDLHRIKNVSTKGYKLIEERIKLFLKDEFEKAKKINSVDTYNKYADLVSWFDNTNFIGAFDYIQKNEKAKEDLLMETDSAAWKLAKQHNNSDYYEKYIQMHPNGIYSKEAYKRFINCVKEENPEVIPILNHSGEISSTTELEITNSTMLTLNVVLSGPEDRILVIYHGETETLCIKSGKYEIVASVKEDSHVIRYYGSERLVGGVCKSNFYIKVKK